MLSIYEITAKGKKTRSQLIAVLNQQNGLTRNEIVQQSGLSYEQVRRQTQNLVSEGSAMFVEADAREASFLMPI